MFMFVTLVCLFVYVFGWCQFLTGITNKCCNTWIYKTFQDTKTNSNSHTFKIYF